MENSYSDDIRLLFVRYPDGDARFVIIVIVISDDAHFSAQLFFEFLYTNNKDDAVS